jgi:WD40 repeat protein/serine/threonine protein kinase/tetratricopeptide (TPR) repeat protein
MSACPSTEVLEQFVNGRLDGSESDSVEAHVGHCPACQRILDELTPALGSPTKSAEPRGTALEASVLDRLKGQRPVVVRDEPAGPPGASPSPVHPYHADDDPGSTRAFGADAATLPIPTAPLAIAGFEIVREVGRGGMGIVYEAIELALGRRVALKVLPPLSAGPTTAARFRREARAAGRLHHTNIVPIFGVGSDGGLLYYAMQFIEGEGLDRLIDRLRQDRTLLVRSRRKTEVDRMRAEPLEPVCAPAGVTSTPPPAEGGPLAPSSGASSLAHARHVARIGLQVADALEYAHNSGFLHRDIKPSNILLDQADTAWVADFGLAKSAEPEEDLTHTGDIIGTLRYMPPERFDGHSDARGDVYALGATLYELLTLRPVFDDPDRTRLIERVLETEPVPPRQLARRVPRDLETIVLKAMAKNPAARYAMAGLMAEDLRRFLEGRPITARRVGMRERVARWARRRPLAAALCGIVTLLLASLLGLGTWSYLRISRALGIEARTRQEMERLSADLVLDRGIALAEDRQVGPGLLWMLRSLDLAPPGAVGLRRAARGNLAAWLDQTIVPQLIIPTGSPIECFALSPDGRTAVTGHSDGRLQTWDLTSGQPLGSVAAHQGNVISVTFRPGRAVVASSGFHTDSTARLWDSRSLRPIGEPMRHPAGSRVLHLFRPDGQVLVTYSPDDGTVRAWDAASGRSLAPPILHPRVVLATFSPDGTRMATTSIERDARLWDLVTGSPLGKPMVHQSAVWGAAFSPDGRRLATVDGDFEERSRDSKVDGRVRIWDVGTGRQLAAGPAVQPGLWTVAFHPDGRRVVAAGFNGFAHLFDVETAQPVGVPMTHAEWVRFIVFSPDARIALTGSVVGNARLFDAETGRALGSIMEHGDEVVNAQFGPDGRTIVTASRDGSLRVWDGRGVAPIGRPLARLSGVQTVEFSPDGHLVATAGFDGTARLFDIATGQPIGPPLIHSGRVRAARFRPDGKVLATGGDDRAVRLWDVATGRPIGPPLLHGHWIVNLRFSPDGRRLLAGRVEGKAKLWDLSASPPRGIDLEHPSKVPGHEVWNVLFIRDGRMAITGATDGSLRFWDAATGRLDGFLEFPGNIRQFFLDRTGRALFLLTGDQVRILDCESHRELAPPFGERILTIALSPDGTTLLAGGADKAARLWDPTTGRPISPMMRHDGVVVGVAFSPDGTMLATVTASGRVRFWDAATAKPIGPYREHVDWVTRFGVDDRQPLTFFPDGQALITAGNAVVVWPVPAGNRSDPAGLVARIPSLVGLRYDEQGDLQRLSPTEWARALEDRLAEPAAPPDPLAWHDRTAAHCENFGPAWAAEWHLDRLIDARPDDWSLFARRARIHRRLGDGARAEADASRAIALGPPERLRAWQTHEAIDLTAAAEAGHRWTEARTRLDGLIDSIGPNAGLSTRRAEAHANLGHWAAAADDLDTAFRSGFAFSEPFDAVFRLRLATNDPHPDRHDLESLVIDRLTAGEWEGYRSFCSALRSLTPRDARPGIELFEVYLLTMGPDGSADPGDTVRRGESAIAGLSQEEALGAQRYLGAALYRAGRYAEAISHLEANTDPGGRNDGPWDWAFLAMAHARLGHDAEARRWLECFRARPGAATDSLPSLDELEAGLLRREAEAVVLLDPVFPAEPLAP